MAVGVEEAVIEVEVLICGKSARGNRLALLIASGPFAPCR